MKENKDITLRFRVTKTELEQIDNLCKLMNMKKSELIRTTLLGTVKNVPHLLKLKCLPIVNTYRGIKN